jgi:AP-3 complex subunit delta-1
MKDEPRFPKSLYLIRPLFDVYELNPVASSAQASVPIPEGLDLDAWFVPPPPEPVAHAEEESAVVEKKKKAKKGKAKEVESPSAGKKKKTKSTQDEVILTPSNESPETLEEKALREKVSL